MSHATRALAGVMAVVMTACGASCEDASNPERVALGRQVRALLHKAGLLARRID